MCSTNPFNGLKDIFELIINPVGMLVRIIANLILAAAIKIFGELTAEVPTLSEEGGEPSMAVPGMISDQVEWVIVYLAIGSILFAAARMAIERRGEAGKVVLKGFLRVILVAGAGSSVAIGATKVSDDFTEHLFSTAALNIIKSVPCIDDGTGMEAFLLLVLAFLLLISAIVHVLMLYIRLGVMILLLGTLPLAAAASMTDWGTTWWRKHLGWTVAWLLYKPAVGLIMFAGSQMLAEGNKYENGVHSRIAGVGILLLSAVALPALLKLVVPATAALGTGNPAGSAISTAGAVIATGAKKVAGSAQSSGGGGGGVRGPSGSRGSDSSQGNGGWNSGNDSRSGRDGRDGNAGPEGSSGRDGSSGHDGRDGGSSSGGSGSGTATAGRVGTAIDAAYMGARLGRSMVADSIPAANADDDRN